LLKATFVAGGGADFNIGGGTLQLVSKTFASRKSMSMLAVGNGSLDFTNEGAARRTVLTSFTLRADSDSVGSFVE
jgi:hypothetical protein